jgi:RHS repeat-associated protein
MSTRASSQSIKTTLPSRVTRTFSGFGSPWPDGTPIAIIPSNTNIPTDLHTDQLGSIRAASTAASVAAYNTDPLTNPTPLTAARTYEPYGKTIANATSPTLTWGTIPGTLGYAGQVSDSETGFLYMRARYYDPATGQFLSMDPLAGVTRAPYSYVANNPVNGLDPSGMKPWWKKVATALDVTSTVLSGIAVALDFTPLAPIGLIVGEVSADLSVASAVLTCGFGGFNKDCAKAAAVALLSSVSFGASTIAMKAGKVALGRSAAVAGLVGNVVGAIYDFAPTSCDVPNLSGHAAPEAVVTV